MNMNENLTKICRFCLYEEKCDDTNKILNIFQNEVDENLVKKIRMYTQIKISPEDKIPSNICSKCVDCIEQFDKFINCCWKSLRILREIYMSNETDSNAQSEKSSSHMKHESQYVFKKEYFVMYNETYVTNIEYFSESASEINEKSVNSDDNEINGLKFEDSVSDILIDDSDSDISSVKKKVETSAMKRENPNVLEVDQMVKIIGDNTYVCSICSMQFKSFFEYQDHQETHNGQLVFSCTKCDQVFSERKKLVEHDANHKVACQVCNKMVLPKSLQAHLKKHTDIYKCFECNLSHTSKAALENHVKARHTGQKGLVCHICGKQSSCQSSLNRHLAYHSSARPFKCKDCNFTAKSRSILTVHTFRKHQGVQKSCEQCGKMFKSEISLKQHVKRMHNPRKHSCHICGKSFVEKHSLDKHVARKHSKQRIYECSVCKEEFHTMRQLKEHMHSHRQGCVNCPNCGRKFFYKKYLEKHMVKCLPNSGAENFEDRLCRLQSTISLPGSSKQIDKLKGFQ